MLFLAFGMPLPLCFCRRRHLVRLSCVFFLLAFLARAANWAQVSGDTFQNRGLTPETPFSKRWGHATARLQMNMPPLCTTMIDYDEDPNADKYDDNTTDFLNLDTEAVFEDQKILLMGGDDWNDRRDGWNAYNGGLRNDVWATTGARWDLTEHDYIEGPRGDPLPMLISRTIWDPISTEKQPPSNMTYMMWLECAAQKWFERDLGPCDPQSDPFPPYWAPRRHHAALSFGRKVYLMGGRARPLNTDIPPWQSSGGILNGARVRNREMAVLLGDIWSTTDGEKWDLVTPGCLTDTPQPDLVRKQGHVRANCRRDADCKGPATCRPPHMTCVCDMWSPRERHAVAVYPEQPELPQVCGPTGPESRMWVFGGFGWQHTQQCGNNTCGGGYRTFLNDVWRTKKVCTMAHRANDPDGCTPVNQVFGEAWEQVMSHAPWAGRGAHAAVVHNGAIWILGGRGGDHRNASFNPLYNDAWSCGDVGGARWHQNVSSCPWSPRESFTAVSVVDEDGPVIRDGIVQFDKVPYMYVVGGYSDDGYLMDVWKTNNGSTADEWVEDYSNGTAQDQYVDADSDVTMLQSVPQDFLSDLTAQGIASIGDLAGASKDQVLFLRGGGKGDGWKAYFEGVFKMVCPHKKRAEALVNLCKLEEPYVDGAEERGEEIYYGGVEMDAARDADADDADCEDEDGCDMCPFYSEEEEQKNQEIKDTEDEEADMLDPSSDTAVLPEADGLIDLVCKQVPAPRAHHSTAVLQGRMFIIGGRGLSGDDRGSFMNDVWYRDYKRPVTTIMKKPRTETSDHIFEFSADEAGCLYEYRLFWSDQYDDERPEELKRNWTLTLGEVDFEHWIYDCPPHYPPTGGRHRFEVRAIDPAGNTDMLFVKGQNVYTWIYYPPIPWLLIMMILLAIIIISTATYYEIRRRRKKRAMERYAIKRMRRKFKGIQKGADKKNVDWRKYYDAKKDPKAKNKKKPVNKEKGLSKRK